MHRFEPQLPFGGINEAVMAHTMESTVFGELFGRALGFSVAKRRGASRKQTGVNPSGTRRRSVQKFERRDLRMRKPAAR